MRGALTDLGGQLTALLAWPVRSPVVSVPRPAHSPTTARHPGASAPGVRAVGEWGSGHSGSVLQWILLFSFCWSIRSNRVPQHQRLGSPSGIQNACVRVYARARTRVLVCLHACAHLQLRYHLPITQRTDLKCSVWVLTTVNTHLCVYQTRYTFLLLQRVSTCPFPVNPLSPHQPEAVSDHHTHRRVVRVLELHKWNHTLSSGRIYSFVPHFFHSACLWELPMLLHMPVVPSFLLLNSSPLDEDNPICLFIPLSQYGSLKFLALLSKTALNILVEAVCGHFLVFCFLGINM